MTWLRLLPFGAIAALVIICLFLNQRTATFEAEKRVAVAKSEQLQERLDRVVEVNKDQAKTIETMAATRAANDELMLSLTASIEKIAANSDLTRSDIRQLERTNAEVRAYLATTLPPELAGVLNRRAEGSRKD